MPSYCADRISEHLSKTPEGYLLAKDVVIARTAVHKPQQYKGSEIGIANDDSVYDVYRAPSEVFSARAIASGEGKPLTSPHPGTFLDPSNTSWYQRGHMQNLRKGWELEDDETALIADLIVTDEALIEQIESGSVRECSLGYQCRYVSREDGSFEQRDLTINHCSIVRDGRAGSEVRIQDAMEETVDWEPINKRLDKLITLLSGKKRNLADEVRTIAASASRSEGLIDTGAGIDTGSFAAALARNNEAYRVYDAEQKQGQQYSEAMKAAGQAQQEKWRRVSCRDSAAPVLPHREASDWADAMNAAGKRLRGR